MCQKCSDAIQEAVKNGISREEATNWLWEHTPFPMGEPTEKQYEELRHLSKVSP